MRVLAKLLVLCVLLQVTGCVSLSRYNAKVDQVKVLMGELESLEATLQESESAKKQLKFELQTVKENLAKLTDEHEQLKAARSTGGNTVGPEIEARKQDFVAELATLNEKLAAADLKIKELSQALAAKEEALKNVPALEAALAEKDARIRELTASLQKLGSSFAELRIDAGNLSRKRSGSEEKEDAVAAIRASLKEEISRGEITVVESRDKLIVSMKNQVLFDSGSTRISRNGRKTLDRMSRVLRKIRNNQILVEGHTDSEPVRRRAGKVTNNWELAAARATTVIKHLERKGNIEPSLLALAGYSSYLPAAENDTVEGRRLNRRIEIALVPLELERLASVKQRSKTALR